MASYTNKIEDMDEQILVKFKKKSYEQIVKKAKAQGLPKSTWVRFITLKAIADGRSSADIISKVEILSLRHIVKQHLKHYRKSKQNVS